MPAPLAMPPTDQPSSAKLACFGTVSVVMIASAAAGPPSLPSMGTRSWIPAVILSIGSRTPIRPVEHTATSTRDSTADRRWLPVRLCGACRRSHPAPVQALAPPEFKITARNPPSLSTCCDHSTGAALTRLLVKTPAAA